MSILLIVEGGILLISERFPDLVEEGNISYLKILPDVLLHLSIFLVKFFVLHCLMLNWPLVK